MTPAASSVLRSSDRARARKARAPNFVLARGDPGDPARLGPAELAFLQCLLGLRESLEVLRTWSGEPTSVISSVNVAVFFAHASGDQMAQHFGTINGYLIFTDLGDRIERAVFGDAGAVENIDLHGSRDVGLVRPIHWQWPARLV